MVRKGRAGGEKRREEGRVEQRRESSDRWGGKSIAELTLVFPYTFVLYFTYSFRLRRKPRPIRSTPS